MYDPPAGFEDILADAEQSDNLGDWQKLEVPDVGTFRCRKPMPNAVAVLGNAVQAKISDQSRNDYIGLFVQNHLSSNAFDKLVVGMMAGKYPTDSVTRVCHALAVWGTARPTLPSSTSHC